MSVISEQMTILLIDIHYYIITTAADATEKAASAREQMTDQGFTEEAADKGTREYTQFIDKGARQETPNKGASEEVKDDAQAQLNCQYHDFK